MSKRSKDIVRVIIPDSHGEHIDPGARDAFLRDLAYLDPEEVIGLGDHLDCGGTFSTHQRSYTNEMTESYDDDVAAANRFLDAVRKRAPNASIDYLEGNHEQHVERWASRTFERRKDAEKLLEHFGPAKVLHLKEREVKYYKRSEQYQGISIPGAIRRGKCYFVHGVSHSKNAADVHLERFGSSVVFGHVHRALSVVSRTVRSDAHGAWCPGTLAKVQPLYKHTQPTTWTHGYAVQFVSLTTGRFVHVQVPIYKGQSGLIDAIRMVEQRARRRAA